MNASAMSCENTVVLRKRKRVLVFLSLVVAGIVVFVATNNAIAGAVLPSIHAGWRSFRTGAWIIQSDHDRLRACICSAFCIATSFWQAAAAALASVVVFVIVAHL